MLYSTQVYTVFRYFNPQRVEVPYKEKIHLHGQRREFRIRNNAQKTKENDVKMILSSLASITPIRLPFCMSTGERERIFVKKKKKKKKKSKSVRNLFTVK